MKKRSKQAGQTKLTFLDAFCKLYSKKPVAKISVQEIAKKAGYNRSTFYQYFSGVHEILDFIENDVLNYVEKNLPKKRNFNLTVTYIQEMSKFFEEKGKYLIALLGKYGNNSFFERIKKTFSISAYDLPVASENPLTPYLIEFHRSTVMSIFCLWHNRKKDLSTEEFTIFLYRLYNYGISGVK